MWQVLQIIEFRLRRLRRYGFAAVGAYTNRLLVHSRHDIATGATMGAYTIRLGVHLRRHSIATGATMGAFMMGGGARASNTPLSQFPDSWFFFASLFFFLAANLASEFFFL